LRVFLVHGALKDAAAELTKTPGELLKWVATDLSR
jgi:hypothetical protein